MVTSLYYVLELAGFLAALWWSGRRMKNEAVENVNTQLIASQNSLIAAQAERIALLEKDKKDLTEVLQKQQARIDYLEEVLGIHGNAPVVQKGIAPHKHG